MARFLIRQAHGGQTSTVSDGALPFFLSQGYVIVDSLDDSTDPSPVYRDAADSDLRYVQTADISDPDSPDGAELRNFFEEKVPRSGAAAGQVPVLQADGTLAFGAGGGGGSGTVTTVNNVAPDGSGNVALSPADVVPAATTTAQGSVRLAGDLGGTADAPTVPTALRAVYNFTNTDPARPATTRPILWVSPDTDRPATNGSTGGGAYAAAEGDFGAFYS